MDERQIDYRARSSMYHSELLSHFTLPDSYEPDIKGIIDRMKLVQQAFKEGWRVSKLAEELGKAMLIVPGDNSVGNGQLTILFGAYTTNQAFWDDMIEQAEEGE